MSQNQFTKGPVRPATDAQGTCGLLHPKKNGVAVAWFSDTYNPSNGYVGDQPEDDPKLGRPERQANAELITAAFNAATKLADMGLDAQKCIEALPELVMALQDARAMYISNEGDEHEFISCITPPGNSSMTTAQRKANKTWKMWDAMGELLTRCKGAE